MAIFRRGLPNEGVECRWRLAKIAIRDQCLASSRVVNGPDRGKLVTLVAVKRRRMLFAQTDDERFMTVSFSVIYIVNTTSRDLELVDRHKKSIQVRQKWPGPLAESFPTADRSRTMAQKRRPVSCLDTLQLFLDC